MAGVGHGAEEEKHVVQSPQCQGVCYRLLGIFSQVTITTAIWYRYHNPQCTCQVTEGLRGGMTS